MGKGSILLTCFEPFGGREVNMSSAAVSALPEAISGRELHKLRLPVVFGEAAEIAAAEAKKLGVSAILSVGEAGGRKALTPELVALNLRYARIPDNLGQTPLDEPVVPGGENALFSTLLARSMAAAVAAASPCPPSLKRKPPALAPWAILAATAWIWCSTPSAIPSP